MFDDVKVVRAASRKSASVIIGIAVSLCGTLAIPLDVFIEPCKAETIEVRLVFVLCLEEAVDWMHCTTTQVPKHQR